MGGNIFNNTLEDSRKNPHMSVRSAVFGGADSRSGSPEDGAQMSKQHEMDPNKLVSLGSSEMNVYNKPSTLTGTFGGDYMLPHT